METLLKRSGDGCGSGYSYGSGNTYGSGSGYSYGSGYGDGYGYGSGDGKVIGTIAGLKVELIRDFQIVKVGCQVHTVSEWRRRWREIATKSRVDVTEEEVAAILNRIGTDAQTNTDE